MPNYAIIENERVVNKVIADVEDTKSSAWVLCDEAEIGWSYINSEFVDTRPPVPISGQSMQVRNKRNHLLASSDWTQINDSTADKAAWATYRQALRDLPQQAGFPTTINWPVKPE